MTIRNGKAEFVRAEIIRLASRIEVARAEIYGVRTACNGGFADCAPSPISDRKRAWDFEVDLVKFQIQLKVKASDRNNQ